MSNPLIPLGFSDAARFIAEAARETDEALRSSASLSKQPAYDELAEVWEDCKTPNWDGYDALPVEQETFRNAYLFIESLPLGIPLPSLGAEPDGHLALEWYRNPRWTLSVSVGPAGTLYYAALFGSSDIRGSEPFFGDVPEIILNLIRRVCRA